MGLLFGVYPLLAVIALPIAVAGATTGLRGRLFQDPAHELGVLWGIFSYFGILMLAGATACCAVGWVFLSRTARSHRLRPWFLASAILSVALMVDDTFLVHDVLLSEYVGIPEVVVLLGYGAGILWYLVRFRRELLDRPDAAVLYLSLLLMGASVAVDVGKRVLGSFPFGSTIEDLPKLLGITAWLYFFFWATIDVLTHRKDPGSAPQG